MTTESDINKLLDKPYSELTDDEIEQVIDWKASIKARDQAYMERLQAIEKGNREAAERWEKERDESVSGQMELLRKALERERILNGGDSDEQEEEAQQE